MRPQYSGKIESGRVVVGFSASRYGEQCGAFLVQGPCGRELKIIVSDGIDDDPKLAGWEHVSISGDRHPPNWQEMAWVAEQFWLDTETVLQFRPRKSEYINCHPHCLHWWRQVGVDHVLPPQLLV